MKVLEGRAVILKSAVIVGGGVVLAGSLYAAYRLWNQANADSKDEGFEDVAKVKQAAQSEVLVASTCSSGCCLQHESRPMANGNFMEIIKW